LVLADAELRACETQTGSELMKQIWLIVCSSLQLILEDDHDLCL